MIGSMAPSLLLLLAACGSGAPPTRGPPEAAAAPAPTAAPSDAAAADAPPTAEPSPAAEPSPSVELSIEEATAVLFAGDPPAAISVCERHAAAGARIRCLIDVRFGGAPAEDALAVGLHERAGHVLGVEREHQMDGGFRGTLHLVPERPVGRHRRHLEWIAAALDDFDAFFTSVAARAPRPLRYRWRALAFRFFRSVGRTTPSAYADGWTVAYNVSGSLHRSADSVRETLFHELFHLNDSDHGDWSARRLRSAFDGIVARCPSLRRDCLAPWAPGTTTVRGGTFYAFQPDNGDPVHEYAAELALRWYREHRVALRTGGQVRSFRCGPAPNAEVWSAIADEFFGGADLVAPCR